MNLSRHICPFFSSILEHWLISQENFGRWWDSNHGPLNWLCHNPQPLPVTRNFLLIKWNITQSWLMFTTEEKSFLTNPKFWSKPVLDRKKTKQNEFKTIFHSRFKVNQCRVQPSFRLSLVATIGKINYFQSLRIRIFKVYLFLISFATWNTFSLCFRIFSSQ